MTQRSVDRTTLLELIAQLFKFPQVHGILLSAMTCPALTRLSENVFICTICVRCMAQAILSILDLSAYVES